MKFKNGEEILNYIISNNLGFVQDTKSMARNSCESLLNQLRSDEELLFVFMASVVPEKFQEIIGAAFGITNRRIIITKKKLMGDFSQSISLENINDVTMNNSGLGQFGFANITIDTIREKIVARTNIQYGNAIFQGIHNVIDNRKLAFNDTQKSENVVVNKSVVDEIKGLKDLLDIGALSKEEFDAKKKQLLGL